MHRNSRAGKAAASSISSRVVVPKLLQRSSNVSNLKPRTNSVSQHPNWRRRRRRQRFINVNSTNSDADDDADVDADPNQPPPPPPLQTLPLFPACDAYSSTRALVLSLLICSVGAGGGVGALARSLSSVVPISAVDARALAAFAVEAAELAAVSLVAASSSITSPEQVKKSKKPLLSFDLFRRDDVVLGIAGGAVAVAAVATADSLLPPSFSSSLSASSTTTATDVATSTLAAASFPLGKAALLAAGCALAPATEEVVFRGILLRALLLSGRGVSSSSVPPLLAGFPLEIAASAAAFAASHLPVLLSDGGAASEGAARETVLLFVLGLALGGTAVAANTSKKEQGDGNNNDDGSFNLAAPIVAHALYNAAIYAFG